MDLTGAISVLVLTIHPHAGAGAPKEYADVIRNPSTSISAQQFRDYPR